VLRAGDDAARLRARDEFLEDLRELRRLMDKIAT
jgi:hypothetical protein